jgi:hypothetical protein
VRERHYAGRSGPSADRPVLDVHSSSNARHAVLVDDEEEGDSGDGLRRQVRRFGAQLSCGRIARRKRELHVSITGREAAAPIIVALFILASSAVPFNRGAVTWPGAGQHQHGDRRRIRCGRGLCNRRSERVNDVAERYPRESRSKFGCEM